MRPPWTLLLVLVVILPTLPTPLSQQAHIDQDQRALPDPTPLLQTTATPALNRQCQHRLLLLLLQWPLLSQALQSCCSLLLLHQGQGHLVMLQQQQHRLSQALQHQVG
jgi:hypothetical protein